MFSRFLCHYCQQEWARAHNAFCHNCASLFYSERYDASYQRCPDCFLPLLHPEVQHTCNPDSARYLLFPSYSNSAYYIRSLEREGKVPRRVCRFFAQLLLEPVVTQRTLPCALANCRFSQMLVKELHIHQKKETLHTDLQMVKQERNSDNPSQIFRHALIVGIYDEQKERTYQKSLLKEQLLGPHILIALCE